MNELYFSKDNFALKVLREFNELTEPSVSWVKNEECLNKLRDDGFIIRIELPYCPDLILAYFVSNELSQEQNAHIVIAESLYCELITVMKRVRGNKPR
ncbi:MAG: hypothetical protein KJ556_21035 [Gammaproteobacteria bacterium]|nr:hypothetical protein [Gammaproteobacteria bacterium]